MKRYYSYVNTAIKIISLYKGDIPLSAYLNNFFSADKRYGSKDRKQITHLCYCFFRLGKLSVDITVEERILLALFLCTSKPDGVLALLKPEWNQYTGMVVTEKIKRSGFDFSLTNIFPWANEISEGIDYTQFCESFLIQPDLFLRIRPGFEKAVQEKLASAGISFSSIHTHCISFSNSTKVDAVLELDKEAVVQDLNSQNIGGIFDSIKLEPADRVWDCCAASGGKSIMLCDLFPDIKLTVSDIRVSILINLKKRFAKAGIMRYERFVTDLTAPLKNGSKDKYKLIIADVPCSGSGTWSRTPEQLYFFQEIKIKEYSLRQKEIVSNVIPYLEPGGFLLYVTCSVFKKENEDVAVYLMQNGLALVQMNIFSGYDKKADTLFAALFFKPL